MRRRAEVRPKRLRNKLTRVRCVGGFSIVASGSCRTAPTDNQTQDTAHYQSNERVGGRVRQPLEVNFRVDRLTGQNRCLPR